MIPEYNLKLSVLNAGGRDSNISYENGIGLPSSQHHAPVNYHAYAACCNGQFLKTSDSIKNGDPVIFLLRSDLKESVNQLTKLKKKIPQSKVFLIFKETSPYQILSAIKKPADSDRLMILGKLADGFLSPTPYITDFLKNYTDKTVAYIPTPYPFHDSSWKFNTSFEQRSGILLGSREFDIHWRMHLPTLIAVRKWIQHHKIKVTVINKDGKTGLKWFESIGYKSSDLNVMDGMMSYPAYLKLAGHHRLIFNQDMGFVPGQIAGDSLLAETPVLGGNSALQKIVYPEYASDNLDFSSLLEMAEKIYFNETLFNQAIGSALKNAEPVLSFDVVKGQLTHLFQRV